jgi:hypothetical protein
MVHKWVEVKLATDDGFRAAHKLNRKRSIDVLREAYGRNSGETLQSSSQRGRPRRDLRLYTLVSLCILNW